MNKHHHHHKCSCQTTDTKIVPNTFIISYLHPLSKQEKQCFLDKIQGVVIDIIGPTRDLVEIYNDNWRHLEPSAIGDLIKSMSGHRVLAYPDLFLTIDDPPSVPVDSPSSTSNSLFDFCNIHENDFPLDLPEDPYYLQGKQWYLTHTKVNEVWQEYLLLGSNITVAVIDSGADTKQEDLQTTFLPGHNVLVDNDSTWDSFGHGTEVSGIIAATTNNGIGMASVAPHAKVRPIKAYNVTEVFLANILKGFEYILKQLDEDSNYVQIINISLAKPLKLTTEMIDVFTNILNRLNSYGVLVVCAAGNEGEKGNQQTFPAILADTEYDIPNIITVGGINENNKPVLSSTHGSNYVQVAAPGTNILSTTISKHLSNDQYIVKEGTSYAAPIVCGILALMHQHIGNIPMEAKDKAKYLRNKLFESAIKTKETGQEEDKYWKYGVVDAYAAIQAIENDPPKPII